MSSDVGDVGDPGLLGTIDHELALQVVGRHHRGLAAARPWPATVAHLGAQACHVQQLGHAVLTVQPAALQPSLQEQAALAFVVALALALGLLALGVEAAGVYSHHLAQA
jgi:hypothetical protein